MTRQSCHDSQQKPSGTCEQNKGATAGQSRGWQEESLGVSLLCEEKQRSAAPGTTRAFFGR